MSIFNDSKEDKKQIELLTKILNKLTDIDNFLHRVPDGVVIKFKGETNMADLVLAQGESKTAVLHYTQAGVDIGQVPVADGPVFSVDQPAELSVSPQPDGTVIITNTNTGNGNVDVNLTGAVPSKSFTSVKVVTCTGVTPPPPPPPVPDGVTIVFQ